MQQKLIVITVLLAWVINTSQAQVGIGTPTPHASAQLDVQSTTKGMLVPRLTTAQRTAIATAAKGLLVFDSDTNSFWYYNGTAWQNMAAVTGGSGWALTGNTGTTAANFIGTTDAQPLRFGVKGGSAGIVDSALGNTGLGVGTLRSITIGFENTANGSYTLFKNTSGNKNTAIGSGSLSNNTTGSDNTANGYVALYGNTTGNYNTANGESSLFSNSTGSNNTAGGYEALRSNTTGSLNTAIGGNALYSNTTANYNVAIGYNSLRNSTGQRNTAIGMEALFFNATGSYNTALGNSAGVLLPNNVNHVTCIGESAGFATTQSNHINIGDLNVTAIGGQVNWSTFSDGRIKNNVQENVPGLNFIKSLRPVTYHIDIIKQDAIANEGAEERIQKMLAEKKQQANGNAAALKQIEEEAAHFASLKLDRTKPKYAEQFEIENIKQTGFIAQEVEAAARKTGYNFSAVMAPKDGKGLYSLRYAEFVVPLVKAVQEQQTIIEEQNNKLTTLQKDNEIIKADNEAIIKDNIAIKAQLAAIQKQLHGKQ